MKIAPIWLIILLGFFTVACDFQQPEQYKTKTLSLDESYVHLEHNGFVDNDIVYEVLSRKDGYIEKVRILLKIDARLNNMGKSSDIKLIDLLIGDKEGVGKNNDLIKKYEIHNPDVHQKNSILFFDLDVSSQKLQQINVIQIYFHLENLADKIIENTEHFYYKNSANLLGIANTFIDSTGFKKSDVLIQKHFNKDKYLNEIGLTIKVTDQDIDDVKDIQVNILSNNGMYQLDFVQNIYIGSDIVQQLKSQQCELLGFNRPGKYYIYYSINIERLKLKEIDSISVKLNDKLYYSNKLASRS